MTTVLIADNDRAVSGLLTEVLQRAGMRAMHAFDGDVAKQLARDPGLGVLVCDLDMPGASGLEVLESLQDMHSPPTSVVISGYLDHRIEQRLSALPFVRQVFRKPFDLLQFADTVRQLGAIGESRASEAATSKHVPGEASAEQ